ncbi:FAD binding domain-containing protein [Chloroflexota bacterium]
MLARPGLPAFDYVRAESLDGAVAALREYNGAAKLMMGGTDLLPGMRDGALRPQVVLDVKQLPGMRDIAFDKEAGLTVGAAVTMNELAASEVVQSQYGVLAEAANTVASYQIRNRATIGGNLCNASPCADTSPAVLVLEGQMVAFGSNGKRLIPAAEFFLGPGTTSLRRDELLTAIRFPVPPLGSAGRYDKLGRCKAGDLALVGVAILAWPDDTVEAGYRVRIALGSVAPVPLRVKEAERSLASQPPGEQAFALAANLAHEAATPISDVRGGAEYQKDMVHTLTVRGLRGVWGQLSDDWFNGGQSL